MDKKKRLEELFLQIDFDTINDYDSIESIIKMIEVELELTFFTVILPLIDRFESFPKDDILNSLILPFLSSDKNLQFHTSNGYVFYPFFHLYMVFKQVEYKLLDQNVIKSLGLHLSNLIKYYQMMEENKSLSKDNELKQIILDIMPEMIAVKDFNNKYILSNQTADQAFSGEYKTVVGKYVKDIYPDEEVENIRKLDDEVIKNDIILKRDIHMLLSKRFVEAETERQVIYDSNHLPLGILTINRNITKRKKMEQQLNQSLEFQDILIRIALEFINVSDDDDVDQKIDEALGLVGLKIKADRVYVFDYDTLNGIMINTHEWCSEGTDPSIDLLKAVPIEDFLDDWYNPHFRGETIHVPDVDQLSHESNLYQILHMQDIKSVLTIPLHINHKLVGFIGFDAVKEIRHWNDVDLKLLKILAELIAQLKKNSLSNQNLLNAIQKAESANQAKSIFLANMSHEIRTPLSGIYNAISLIEDTKNPDKQRHYIDIAKASIDSLSLIIDDIFDLTRIENHSIKLNPTVFNLENEIYQIAKMSEHSIVDKKLELIYLFDYQIDHYISGDHLRLRQILLNLINNATKFTDNGSISIQTHLKKNTDTHYVINFLVSDTGIGIPQSFMDQITDRFVQVDSLSTKNYRGVGLGLSIVKGLLSLFESELVIHSVVGQGSSFSFDISFEKKEPIYGRNQMNKNILIMSSNGHGDSGSYSCLSSLGYHVDIFKDDNPHLTEKQYDYILYVSPSIEISQKNVLHDKQTYGSSDVKTIVVKDTYFSTITLDFAIKNFDFVIDLPISRDRFISILNSKSNEQKNGEDADKYPNPPIEKTLLVVDDNSINREALKEILISKNYKVFTASSGQVAIDLLNNHQIDLVLMDIQMPVMDGYMTTKIIRDMNYSFFDLPVMAVSANQIDSSQTNQNHLFNDYLVKPFKPNVLFNKIQTLLSNSTKQCDLIPESIVVFNQEKLLELYANNKKTSMKIIESFIQDFNKDSLELINAFENKKAKALKDKAHYLKGATGYVQAERLHYIFTTINDLDLESDEQTIKKLLSFIDEEYKNWLIEIDTYKGDS